MRLYNTLTRREEPFTPSQGNIVTMYTCGLTVYARGHIGNFRTFVALDVLRRALEFVGYDVRQVRNYTDVDDRTIVESLKSGKPLREYTQQFVDAFERDAAAIGLEPVEFSPRATDHIDAMAGMIKALEQNGHTYTSDGSIYFKISTFPEYGRLARLDHGGIKSGARVDSDKYEKEDARDFVLWKSAKPDEPAWEPGLPKGRPGWHIECSAMAEELLGELPIDIHGGGVDLIFPHHENEIAQAEGATNRTFSRFWVHVEHLMIETDEDPDAVKTEKMSKSLGNVYNLEDIVSHGFRPSTLRYLYLNTHYRKQLRFSWSAMRTAEEALKRLMDFLARLAAVPAGPASDATTARLKEASDAFAEHIRADLNAAGGLGVTFELVRALNSAIDAGELRQGDAAAVRETFERFDSVLGILSLRRAEDEQPPVPVGEIEQLIQARRAARASRNFAEADRIRKDLDARGIVLEDTGEYPLETKMNGPQIKTPLPGPKAKAIIDTDAAFVSPSYTRDYPLVIARGEGAIVEDVDGNTFLDCAAGIAVNSTGVSHPEVVKAIADQAAKFIHMSGTDFYYEPQVRLAEQLASLVPIAGDVRSFFANSGTETTEAAIKLSRYYTKRPNIIAFLGSFHGRSLGALALTSSKSVQRRHFGPLMPGVFHAPYPDQYRFNGSADACAEASLAVIREQILVNLTAPDEVAAIVVEPIQGEGGYIVPPKSFLHGLRELATQHGIMLVLDEVQSGMGRTGKMFAAEHFDVTGDIVNIAKGIASGLPLGITCARKDVMTWPPGAHASTFGGNPVACAAALVTIRLLREQYVQNAATVGAYLMDGLRALAGKHAIIGDVRGRGLMIGVELVRDRQTKERAIEERNAVVQAMFRRGVLILGAGRNAIRFAPPLVLSKVQADDALRIFDEALTEVGAKG